MRGMNAKTRTWEAVPVILGFPDRVPSRTSCFSRSTIPFGVGHTGNINTMGLVSQFGTGQKEKTDSSAHTSAGNRSGRRRPRGKESSSSGKRKLGSLGGPGNDKEDPNPSREPHPKRAKDDDSRDAWACPYAKLNPIKYSDCLAFNLSKLSYVKQHLYRAHWIGVCCQHCGQNFSDNADDREARVLLYLHLRQAPENLCQNSDRASLLDGKMSDDQKEMIMNAKSRGIDEHGRWYQLWDILFPGTERPRSPYAQPIAVEILESFRSALGQNIGTEVIREVSILQQLPVDDCVQLVERTVSAFIRRLQQGPSSLGPVMDTSPLATEDENLSFSEATGTITPVSPILYSMPPIQRTQPPDFSGSGAVSPTPSSLSSIAYLWGSDYELPTSDHVSIEVAQILPDMSGYEYPTSREIPGHDTNNMEIRGLALRNGDLMFDLDEATGSSETGLSSRVTFDPDSPDSSKP